MESHAGCQQARKAADVKMLTGKESETVATETQTKKAFLNYMSDKYFCHLKKSAKLTLHHKC